MRTVLLASLLGLVGFGSIIVLGSMESNRPYFGYPYPSGDEDQPPLVNPQSVPSGQPSGIPGVDFRGYVMFPVFLIAGTIFGVSAIVLFRKARKGKYSTQKS